MNNNILKQFDYFSIKQSFRYKDSYKYKSRLGGAVFCLYFLLACAYFVYSLIPFIRREKFMLTFDEQISSAPPVIDLHDSNFRIAVGLVNEDFGLVDEELKEYINIAMWRINFEDAVDTNTSEKVEMHDCTKDDFDYLPEIDKETIFKNWMLSMYKCSNLEGEKIGGNFANGKYVFLKVKVSIKKEYRDQESIKKFFKLLKKQAVRVTTFFNEAALDEKNTENPISNYLSHFSSFLSYNTYKSNNIYLKKYEFVDDQNFLFDETSHTSLLVKDNEKIDGFQIEDRSDLDSKNSYIMSETFIKASQSVRRISREYMKVPQFLAETTVILSNIILILVFMMQFVNEFNLNKEMMNQIIDFRENVRQNKEAQEVIKAGEITNTETNTSNSYLKKDSSSKTLRRCETIPVKTGLIKAMISNLKNNKDQAYKKGMERLNYYLSSITVARMLQEVEVFWKLLFSKNERVLLRFLSKPILQEESEEERVFENFEFGKEDLTKVVESLKSISKEEGSLLKERILRLAEEKIKHISE